MWALKTVLLTTAAIVVVSGSVMAQGTGSGPVATQCAADIKKFCAGKQHGSGDIRACLEAKKAEVSQGCKNALETTGAGAGRK